MKINLKSFDLIKDKNQKFRIFYKYRFNKEYLEHNIKKKVTKPKKFKEIFDKILVYSLIYSICKNNFKIGLIYYNKKNGYYFIIIDRKYRNKGYGKLALKKLINILKRKKLKLRTLVSLKNKNSFKIHENLCIYKKKYNKNFFYFKLL